MHMQLHDTLQLDVYMGERKVGMLAAADDGSIAFQYDQEWLADGYSISPFSLPLEQKVFIAARHPFDGLFGVFDDSLPDGWGRLLVDRMLKRNGLDPLAVTPLQRLAIVGDSGMGALSYRPQTDLMPKVQSLSLDRLAADCAVILRQEGEEDLDTLYAMGGSSGGARPKVLFQIDGEDWIVKFPSSHDPHDIGLQEFRIALAAKECGIIMPEVKLMSSEVCGGYFAIKRFDRMHSGDKVGKKHMLSAGALLETSHRVPNLSYELLMKLALRLTGEMEEVERMFVLMVFNVAIGNRDDHAKNFTFIREKDGWVLSPAYDLTQNAGMNGEHATTVQGKGRGITSEDMLQAGIQSGLSERTCRRALRRIHDVVGDAGLLQ